MPAKKGNKNASGKRVDRNRITVSMGISRSNGLLDLFEEYLLGQGIEPTNENIKEVASTWAYHDWAERLKREIEITDGAIII